MLESWVIVILVVAAAIVGFAMAWVVAYKIGQTDGEERVEEWYRAKRRSGDHRRVYHKGDAFKYKNNYDSKEERR